MRRVVEVENFDNENARRLDSNESTPPSHQVAGERYVREVESLVVSESDDKNALDALDVQQVFLLDINMQLRRRPKLWLCDTPISNYILIDKSSAGERAVALDFQDSDGLAIGVRQVHEVADDVYVRD